MPHPTYGFANLTLHIGLHKTGTTFLQREVFPRWRGITYVPTDNLEVLLRVPEGRPVLLSREGLSGRNWAHHEERELSIGRLATLFPRAKVLLSVRRHSGFIASSYTQYLQRGGYLSWREYFDVERDRGLLKRADFSFRRKIQTVEAFFGRLPFVFTQDELFTDLGQLLSHLERFIGGSAPDPSCIRQRIHNQSVRYHPAQLLRVLNRYARSELNPHGRFNLYHWRLRRWHLDPRSICQYGLRFFPRRPMLSPEESQRIDEDFADDWQYTQDIARRRLTDACRPAAT